MKRARKINAKRAKVLDTAFMDPWDDSSKSVEKINPYAVVRRDGDGTIQHTKNTEHPYEYEHLLDFQKKVG